MTKQWLNFDEVMEKLGAAEFEIIELYKSGLTPINTETGEPLPYIKPPQSQKLLQEHEIPAEYLKVWNTLVDGQRWANVIFLFPGKAGTAYLVRVFRKYSFIKWQTKDVDAYQGNKAPAKRQSTIDKEDLQVWVKSLGKKPGPQAELARKAKKEQQFKPYQEITLLRWIKEVHPDHTPGKPGRKKSKINSTLS